ncbi:NAD-dependent epimerase/dehydratase family protein [Syntrophomonas wolfei]|uniref:Nucleoside-diphosphate-sugar epimerases-like protein n=1 Tax=Syntrophomonas wolfei subsp. wolfei (strain DSM 2245B / Goettingen) TaxID=335541 RepID=Q0AZ02_SYNWW|nr:nucleoside-diphosphate-sugar epimerases-like protein [Syntrophomonas wolfei]ABI68052.1 nucleoside-diphosphate-sugar epimerases-like protein [Syntrophomonas wolfei subsp. wolfei str. Goettingen G311]
MLYVTGITGHSGQWFVKRLISEGYKGRIRCIVLPESDTDFLNKSGLDIDIVSGNLNDQEFLTSTMVGCSTVLHIASIDFSRNVVKAALDNNLDWAILVHTTGRYSKYKSASAEYIEIEEYVLKFRNRMGITVLRPTMIYGSSRDRNMYKLITFLHKIKFFPMFGEGENLMQPVHARDLGNAYYDVIVNRSTTFNKGYNLPGKRPLTYMELVRTVSDTLGRKNVIIKIPLWFSILAARVYNALDKNAIISVEQVLRMQEDKAFDYEDAVRDFSYSPVSFEDGIVEEVNEYLARYNSSRTKQR